MAKRALPDIAGENYDIVFVGNGAAIAAVVQRLHEACPTLRICVLGTGGALVDDHAAPVLTPVEWGRDATRRSFLVEHGIKTWDGPGLPAGVLLLCVGGSEVDGGNCFPRQLAADILTWPVDVRRSLRRYYPLAEAAKGVVRAEPAGSAQTAALARLVLRSADSTPRGYATDGGRPDPRRRNPSAAARLASCATSPYVTLVEDAYVTLLASQDRRVSGVAARNWSDPAAPAVMVTGGAVVVGLDPIEGERLLLNSGLDLPGVGLGVHDHWYSRGWFDAELGDEVEGNLDLLVPPATGRTEDRFAIEVKTFEPLRAGRGQVRVTAMVPVHGDGRNRVTLSDHLDRHGVRKAWVELAPGKIDERRARQAEKTARAVAGELGGRVRLERLPLGRSHHHAGGLSFGAGGPVTSDCRLKDVDNLFIAGRALFPTIGIANPVLTMTAIGFRLADHLAELYAPTRRLISA